jgi:hypothetical protein
MMGGSDIEFLDRWSYLGHIISSKRCVDDAIRNRKTRVIDEDNNQLRIIFHPRFSHEK